jgi:pilus assembly protein CpaB
MQQRQQTGGRGKAYLFLGVSLIAAVLAAVMVVQLLKNMQKKVEKASAPSETVDVVVASRNLYMGLPIQEGDVAIRRLAPEMVPAEVVFTAVDQVVGRTPKERILSSEIVRSERLARREAGIGMNAIITRGKRAVSVGVKAEDAVAGFIQPLNYVDVIVVIRPDSSKEMEARAVSKTLLQGIKVLAVGDSLTGIDGDETQTAEVAKAKTSKTKKKKKPTKNKGHVKGKRTVTLEVTLEEAEELALASEKGDITLALRADVDITQVETHGATADTLIGYAPDQEEDKPLTTMAKRPPSVQKTGPQAEVVSGGTTTVIEFSDDGRTEKGIKKKK